MTLCSQPEPGMKWPLFATAHRNIQGHGPSYIVFMLRYNLDVLHLMLLMLCYTRILFEILDLR